ncbi:tRNA lysidine(34) synthetase TilS [Dolichospermum sp. ST_con]|nr:tRNA lysidine(34) synthetase TilS [Dolichospermum sp. ST_con]MDD1420428.1 tRNA lysidine(34) synthetase TilS [Dolichospermum sp. ST_sed1]MDD1425870.1 tRNA lysidine(34) synthetase TilS [Dolichospermum sp. ST_sed9]MDD1433132.1 tRNA lysidine(34) synthetase TilS [Dolichospermum sp. ST_sed6]MDD1436887.1 tRNA lysidine(34) synthetase TilS [Dolichospermum sp. ST_sed10]MDD1442977.1 tRNA lysidine(34) synthetase TilS [Dolichospermum sp. ST_sed3]MDD1447430.1 tRNA lysidine(34) synthetase TilS [Dolichosp
MSLWTPLHAQIHRTIRARHLFEHNQKLLVAVSGGQDSLCLIRLLLDLQPKWGWNIAIAHCDHCWREDSQANAHHVENLAKTWNTPFYLETANQPVNSEATARNWRYQALTKIAQLNHYQYIITGHTASDRAETLLYNLMRGTGADGLQALTWQRPLTENIILVRPLLEITRSQTEQFCQKFNLPIWEDSTNQNLQYPRNRIRQELIPYLKENFNPQVEANLAQTAELLQAEVEFLEQAALQWRLEASSKGDRDNLQIDRRILQKAPLALQRRVMRQILQEILPDAPNFEHIEKLAALITAPNRSQTDPFPGGLTATVQDDWIVFN